MEEWRDIPGYEGFYKISNIGNLYSVKRKKILKPSYTDVGYLHITLYKKSSEKTFSIHRLVAMAFIPNPHNLPCINHKDEVKDNNNVNNLEWCTYSYNNHYGTARQRLRESHLNHKSLSIPVICLLNENVVQEYPSLREAERITGIKNQNISSCCRGKNKTAGGYVWRYKQI